MIHRDPRYGNTPITVRGLHHVFWVPARYASVAAKAGHRTTWRSLAEGTGYSLAGAQAAVARLRQLGIIGTFRTVRGCRGWLRFDLQHDVVRENVRTSVREILSSITTAFTPTYLTVSLTTTEVSTFTDGGGS